MPAQTRLLGRAGLVVQVPETVEGSGLFVAVSRLAGQRERGLMPVRGFVRAPGRPKYRAEVIEHGGFQVSFP